MKKQLSVVCIIIVLVCNLFLAGCSNNNLPSPQNELKSVEQVCEIPYEFKEIVEKNTFNGVRAFDGRLLKAEI